VCELFNTIIFFIMNNKLTVVRHWPTDANLEKRIVWISDVSLNKEWVHHAHKIWNSLAKEYDLIISSPMKRATQTASIISKYSENIRSIIFPTFHPQNFWVLEWLTVDEARKKNLEQFIHTPHTDKFTHFVEWGETVKQMQERAIIDMQKIMSYVNKIWMNVLVISHNSIWRSLRWKFNWTDPRERIENEFKTNQLLHINPNTNSVMTHDFNNDYTWSLPFINYLSNINPKDPKFNFYEFASKFAKLVENDEKIAMKILYDVFPWLPENFLQQLSNTLEGTIRIDKTIENFKEAISDIEWVYSLLHFWGSLFWKNFSVTKNSDIDVEILVDDEWCDGKLLEERLFQTYDWDFEKDFSDFMRIDADYFSFKCYKDDLKCDFRITKKSCFDKICSNKLTNDDPYVMKEFRKKFRLNGIIPVRKSFDWESRTRDLDINHINEGQILHYPLFKYESWKFVWWNNLDKYCSFTDAFINWIEVKKKLFELQKKFWWVFQQQKEEQIIDTASSISDIFIRKTRFPNNKTKDLEQQYDFYRNM